VEYNSVSRPNAVGQECALTRVAAALFMENLGSTIIVTALPQMARSSAPVESA
jgi:hypothetical protein